ncbi:MAG TPA: L,D-transpeptidase [Devosiaceae bacterium]|jgi:lipoprotein-anchoring transpeptidase ErfK/SrfK|nr:L,D-transpeptidase [Devosiaceae bacterium]
MLRSFLVAFAMMFSVAPVLAGQLSVVVDISSQMMLVSADGATQYSWPVSTGRKGFRTPTGSFHPTRMAAVYYSRKYDNSPMPHSVFFRGGFAIHGTEHLRSLGRPASHGCVRLHPANAAVLYSLVREHGFANTFIRIKP